MTASGDALHLSTDSESDTGAAASSLRFSRTVDSLGAMISGPGGPDDEYLDKVEEGGEEMDAESLRLSRHACLGSVDAEAGPSGSRRRVTDARGASSPTPEATMVVLEAVHE